MSAPANRLKSTTGNGDGHQAGQVIAADEWDDYFYEIADVISKRSKDSKKVGAVIVGEDHVLLATGYNGLARGVLDQRNRIQGEKSEKLRWMCHAEANAIFNAARVGTVLKDGTIYVTKFFPCVDCAGAIVQTGIKRVYTKGDFWRSDPNGDDGSRAYRVLAEGGVQIHAPKLTGWILFGDEANEEAARLDALVREVAVRVAPEIAKELREAMQAHANARSSGAE